MISALFEKYDITSEPKEVRDMLLNLEDKGIKVIPISKNKYTFNYSGTDCIIDTKDYKSKKKISYYVKSMFKWHKLVLGVLIVAKILLLIKFLSGNTTVPEDKKAREEYDKRLKKSGLDSILSFFV